MLRSFEQLRRPSDGNLLVADNDEQATIRGGGRAYAMPWHWHDCLMLMLPKCGNVELKDEDMRDGVWLSRDRFALLPAGCAHATRAGFAPHEHVALYVTKSALRRIDRDIGSLSEFNRRASAPVFVQRTPALRALQDLMLHSGPANFGGGAIQQRLASALLLQCISDVVAGEPLPRASHRGYGRALVGDIKSFLARHLDEDIPLDALAERFGISRRHATRLFRERAGLSIGEFHNRVRLEKACELLSETDLPIGEIAYRVGFENGATLARAMRRGMGQSPSEARATMARSVKL